MNIFLCLCDVWKGQSSVNVNVSVCSIFKNDQFNLKYHFLFHINLLLEEIQQKCKLLRLYSQFSFTKNINSTTVLYIYNILEERPKALLKVFLIDVDGVTLPRRTQDYFNYYYHLWLLFQRFCFNKRGHLVFSNLKKLLVYLFDFKFD